MLLFKTSGETLNSVIANQKHAFKTKPSDWSAGEIILVSKNKGDRRIGEKQIQYIMFLDSIRRSNDEEFETYWPGNRGRWKYMADCSKTVQLQTPFNIEDVLGSENSHRYRSIQTFGKLDPVHEQVIEKHLRAMGAL
jgi:hypothetical protein